VLLAADADSSTIVPVNSSFFPTCGASAVELAMSRYVWALDVDGALDGDIAASASTYFALAASVPSAAAVAPAVPVVPAVPVAAGVVSVDAGADLRQPVTVTRLSVDELAVVCGACVVVCGVVAVVCGDGVWAINEIVAAATIALHVPAEMMFVILPPGGPLQLRDPLPRATVGAANASPANSSA
jgi:hypothetical protein